MKIIVTSNNPVKIAAVEYGFEPYLEFIDEEVEFSSISVESGVSEQPIGDQEIKTGAINRVNNAKTKINNADFYVGLEGGVDWRSESELIEFSWISILSSDSQLSLSKTGEFKLPPRIAQLIKTGKDLGTAADEVLQLENSKQKDGAVGFLTNSGITRTTLLGHAVKLALIPFFNEELYE